MYINKKGDQTTEKRKVTVNFDLKANPDKIMVSEDKNFTGSKPIPFPSSRKVDYTLSFGEGKKVIYAQLIFEREDGSRDKRTLEASINLKPKIPFEVQSKWGEKRGIGATEYFHTQTRELSLIVGIDDPVTLQEAKKGEIEMIIEEVGHQNTWTGKFQANRRDKKMEIPFTLVEKEGARVIQVTLKKGKVSLSPRKAKVEYEVSLLRSATLKREVQPGQWELVPPGEILGRAAATCTGKVERLLFTLELTQPVEKLKLKLTGKAYSNVERDMEEIEVPLRDDGQGADSEAGNQGGDLKYNGILEIKFGKHDIKEAPVIGKATINGNTKTLFTDLKVTIFTCMKILAPISTATTWSKIEIEVGSGREKIAIPYFVTPSPCGFLLIEDKLTIKPGVKVRFAKGSGLLVRGRRASLQALGKKGEKIEFTSGEDVEDSQKTSGYWVGIEFTEGGGGNMNLCNVYYSAKGIPYPPSKGTITNIQYQPNQPN
jgi:hypothetical protein